MDGKRIPKQSSQVSLISSTSMNPPHDFKVKLINQRETNNELVGIEGVQLKPPKLLKPVPSIVSLSHSPKQVPRTKRTSDQAKPSRDINIEEMKEEVKALVLEELKKD